MTQREIDGPVHVNGKWLSRPVTGTERYAHEIMRYIVRGGALRLLVHVPSDAIVPSWLAQGADVVRHRSRGQLFEQLVLPFATRGSYLINLGGPASLLKRKQLVTMHDAAVLRVPGSFSKAFVAWYRLMYKVLARSARDVVTVSDFSRGELSAALGTPPDRWSVVPCGHEHFAALSAERPQLPSGFREDEPFVLCVGTLARHKNLLGPVRAMAEAGWKVLVVGAGGPAKVFARDVELPMSATILGRVSDEELAWCYDRAFALVFPSLYEGFGLPVVEAQSRGCLVVASQSGALPDTVGNGGLLFPPQDADALLACLARLRDDPEERRRLVSAGQRNLDRFRWDESAARVADMVRRPDQPPRQRRFKIGKPHAAR